MRGKRKIFGFAALLSVLLTVPLVFSLGIVDVPKFSFGGSSSTVESSSSTLVFMNPAKNITDYTDSVHNVTEGSTVTFHIDISDVADLFVWQVKIAWNPYLLNVSNIIPGEFLAQVDPEETSSEALGWVMNLTDNDVGTSSSAESILGNVSGISGGGRLVSIEFLIVGYNRTDLTISAYGSLPTELLNSTGLTITCDKAHGFFSNIYLGDADTNRNVNYDDLVILALAYGASSGQPAYDWRADFDYNGAVNYDDLVPLAIHYGTGV